MLTRIRLLCLVVPLALAANLAAANLDGSSHEAGAAEAARLYRSANDYVSNVREGEYSYSYVQFYWKKAQANVDRIRRVYADSPTAKALDSGELKLGPYTLDYFKERLLYRLEQKRLAAYDAVYCSIFLYGLQDGRRDEARDAAFQDILEVMARQKRWAEVLGFPVLANHRALLFGTIFKEAARDNQEAVVNRLIAQTSPAEQQAAGFWPTLAEAAALLGKPQAAIDQLVAEHPDDQVRLSALQGMVQREVLLKRMKALHIPIVDAVHTTHFMLLNPGMLYDVPAVAQAYFPGRPDAAEPAISVYRASEGEKPEASAGPGAHRAYLRWLADQGRWDEVEGYGNRSGLASADRRDGRLFAIELFAEAGKFADSDRLRLAMAERSPEDADPAALAQFRGRMNSVDFPLTIREKSFAGLPIKDPCILAQAIMEWSLTPNRDLRGAAPWDAVVFRYAPGFENLPKPKSAVVNEAASSLKPY